VALAVIALAVPAGALAERPAGEQGHGHAAHRAPYWPATLDGDAWRPVAERGT
jgi:hypothetical protein